ncbi:hypothetical protein, partial [Arcticibacter tournemirensis]
SLGGNVSGPGYGSSLTGAGGFNYFKVDGIKVSTASRIKFSGVGEDVNSAGKWYEYFNDHHPGGDFLYELNKLNPIANVVNGISTYLTGKDSYGVSQTNTTATLQIASAIPIGKISGITVNASESLLGHIFRDAVGHVNPVTIESKTRYLNLFAKVAGNPNNLVPTVNPSAANAGILTFYQTFRNGRQVWVQTLNGEIRNAGVNLIP